MPSFFLVFLKVSKFLVFFLLFKISRFAEQPCCFNKLNVSFCKLLIFRKFWFWFENKFFSSTIQFRWQWKWKTKLTHETTLPLKHGKCASSSTISSLTTLWTKKRKNNQFLQSSEVRYFKIWTSLQKNWQFKLNKVVLKNKIFQVKEWQNRKKSKIPNYKNWNQIYNHNYSYNKKEERKNQIYYLRTQITKVSRVIFYSR